MLTALLPLLATALSTGAGLGARADAVRAGEAPVVVVTAMRTAQVQLAVTLSEADAIHAVGGRAGEIRFSIDRDGEAFAVVATTRTKGRHAGEVIGLTITDVGPALGGPGGLSWLGAELADATAVTGLTPDDDGAVTITTSDGRSYMAIPGRGSGGNAAAEARWAAAWGGDRG